MVYGICYESLHVCVFCVLASVCYESLSLWYLDLQEYGVSQEEKLDIAQAYCLPLMKKIQLDLQRTHEDEAVNKLHPL